MASPSSARFKACACIYCCCVVIVVVIAASLPDTRGSCCLPNATCVAASETECEMDGGNYHELTGNGPCSDDIKCLSFGGWAACCIPGDGVCVMTNQSREYCNNELRGAYKHEGSSCPTSCVSCCYCNDKSLGPLCINSSLWQCDDWSTRMCNEASFDYDQENNLCIPDVCVPGLTPAPAPPLAASPGPCDGTQCTLSAICDQVRYSACLAGTVDGCHVQSDGGPCEPCPQCQ